MRDVSTLEPGKFVQFFIYFLKRQLTITRLQIMCNDAKNTFHCTEYCHGNRLVEMPDINL